MRSLPLLNVALVLLSLPILASAQQDSYLCKQLERIRAEEKMPAIGAGVIVPDPGYPATAAQPWKFILCANGVEKFGESKPVNLSTLFPLGSISKPVSGLMIARVIADQQKKAHPKLGWDTKLIDFFPEIATLAGSNRCYDQRTVADMMAHTAGFPHHPSSEPGDQWASVEPNVVARRQLYVLAAVKDPPAVNCLHQGQVRPVLPASYNGGPIIPAHMAEIVTSRSWEDLMRGPGSTTADPGLLIGLVPDLSVAPEPVAYSHVYSLNGIPEPQRKPGPAPTNGPAGQVYLTVPQMARILTEYMDASKNSVNRQLPDAERSGLFTKHGLSDFNRLGWKITSLDTANFGSVARWKAAEALWHNGSTLSMYAEVYIVPAENAGMLVMLNADGPYDNNTQLLIPNRANALKKVYAELAAMRLHYGDAVDIIQQQVNSSVSISGVFQHQAAAITDGRLSTKWTARAGTSATTITLTYAEPVSLDRIVVIEDGGANIDEYDLAYQDAKAVWHVVAKSGNGNAPIFPHRIFDVPRPPQSIPTLGGSPLAQAKRIRLRILHSAHPPEIVEIAAGNLAGRPHRPLWWRQGLQQLAPKGPIIDPGPRLPADRPLKQN